MGFPFLARLLDSMGGGIDRMGWQTDEPRQLSYQNSVHTLFFLVVGDTWKKQALQYKYITSREGLQRSELGFTTLSRKRT